MASTEFGIVDAAYISLFCLFKELLLVQAGPEDPSLSDWRCLLHPHKCVLLQMHSFMITVQRPSRRRRTKATIITRSRLKAPKQFDCSGFQDPKPYRTGSESLGGDFWGFPGSPPCEKFLEERQKSPDNLEQSPKIPDSPPNSLLPILVLAARHRGAHGVHMCAFTIHLPPSTTDLCRSSYCPHQCHIKPA